MSESIHCGAITASIVRSARRKSIGIYIREGEVTVRAPLHEPQRNIESFVHQKQVWIQAHLQHQQSLLSKTQHNFKNGDTFYWLNSPLNLSLKTGRPGKVEVLGNQLHVTCQHPDNTASVKRLIEHWYKTAGLTWLESRTEQYASLLGVSTNGISLKRYKSRWGSCTRNGSIQFNWLILMAPLEVVDYVVIHELCHIKHFNHSKAFWRLVASIQPEYSRYRHWLKTQTQLAWPSNDRN